MNFGKMTLILAACAALVGQAHADPACENLKQLQLPDTIIAVAESHPAGTEEFAGRGMPGVGPTSVKYAMPAYCRVTGSIHPTADSDIRFEVWMPVQGWNHRYQQVGNAGLAGAIQLMSMVNPLQQGWAVAGTDDGHTSMNDAHWALGHPEKVIDFGYRAVHLTALRAQAIVQAFYRTKAAHRYFIGCSDGGRESLMEAQRYPDDFDGFLAGSPARDMPGLMTAAVYGARVAASLGSARLSAAQMQFVVKRELQQCDALDGLRDGVIAEPHRCRFDPGQLVCRNSKDGAGVASGACLTPAQAAAIRKVYDGPRDPRSGQPFAYGFADTVGTPVPALGVDSLPDTLGRQFYGYLVYGNPDIDPATLDLRKAENDARSKLADILDPARTDLRPLRVAGKKLIQYHGWADPVISAESSLAYFEAVQRTDGDTRDFYRLFMVPGMGHCGGGVGPTWLTAPAVSHDAAHDAVLALTRWVETGVAPDQIIATEFAGPVTNLIVGPAAGTPVKSTRPVCAYPRVARYRGHGRSSDASSFECASSP